MALVKETLDSRGATDIVAMLEHHARASPSLPLYTFVQDRGKASIVVTAAELWHRAMYVAARLGAQVAAGERVVLLCPTGPEFVFAFFGCLASGVIAVPCAMPRRNRARERLASVISKCAPRAVLTLAPNVESLRNALSGMGVAKFLAVDDLVVDEPTDISNLAALQPNAPAFLQFTSGSTATPTGVVVTHANLMANQQMIQRAMRFAPSDRMVSWLPLFHDMGLVGSALQPVFTGFPSILMPPTLFLKQPLFWLTALDVHDGTVSGAPNFAFELVARLVERSTQSNLDLSRVRLLYNGAEPVQARTLERFARALEPYGLREEALFPCYGLAEATLFVSGGPPAARWRGQSLQATQQDKSISCGVVAQGSQVEIVDPETLRRLPDDEIGEIWVAGPHVAPGYWGDPQLSAAVFEARTADGRGPFLRTGDLGLRRQGSLFVTGRRKDLVILRGRNVYPHDVEAAALDCLGHLYVGNIVALDWRDEGQEEGLALAIETPREKRASAAQVLESIGAKICRAVSEHCDVAIVALFLVGPGMLPRTTSGKIRRNETREALREHRLPTLARWAQAAAADSGAAFDRDGLQDESRTNRGSEVPLPEQSRVVEEITKWLREYASRRMDRPLAEERRLYPPNMFLDFAEKGLFGLRARVEEGGLGLCMREAMRLVEEVAAIDTGFALVVGIHNALGLEPLRQFGSAALLASWSRRLAGGRQLAALAVTEDSAGSNPAAIETVAVRTSAGWRVTGTKRWTGLAAWAGVINVIARARGETGESLGTIALALPAHLPGLDIGPESLTFGARGVVQSRVSLRDVEVPDDHRLGAVGQGLQVAQQAFAYGRLGVAAICLGGMKHASAMAYRYAQRRRISTGMLADNALIQVKLDDLIDSIEIVESLVRQTATAFDKCHAAVPVMTLTCKIIAPELAYYVVDTAMQILGGRGYEENSGLPQLLRDVRLTRIFEGPSETLVAHLGALARLNTPELQHAKSFLSLPTDFRGHPSGDAAFIQLQDSGRGWHVAVELAAACAERSVTGARLGEKLRVLVGRLSGFELSRDGLSERALDMSEGQAERRAALSRIAITDTADRGYEWERDPLLRSGPAPVRDGSGDSPVSESFSIPIEPDEARLRGVIRDAVERSFADEGRLIATITDDTSIAAMGLDSLRAVQISLAVESATGREIDATVLYEHDTVSKLASYLRNCVVVQREPQSGPAVQSKPSLASLARGAEISALAGSTLDFLSSHGPDLRSKAKAFRGWQRARINAGLFGYAKALASAPRPRTSMQLDDGRTVEGINFSSQDYLSLAGHPRVRAAAHEAIERLGVHSAGSSALAGNVVDGFALEKEIASFVGHRHALLFPTGWAAGFGVIRGLVREGDAVIMDALAHSCLQEGAAAATKHVYKFRHLDTDHVAELVKRIRAANSQTGVLIVTESLFSMDSDSPNLRQLQRVCCEHDALLVVDVAHDLGSMGETGRGWLEAQDMVGKVDVLIGSFSKTFASNGGFVSSNDESVYHYLRFYSSPNTFSNALSPLQIAVVREALRIVAGDEGRQRRAALMRNVQSLRGVLARAGATVLGAASPLVPVLLGEEGYARRVARRTIERGVLTNLVEYPAVNRDEARLRMQVMTDHGPAECEGAAREVASAIAECRNSD